MTPRFIFSSPWYLVLPCILLAAGLAALVYYRNRRNSEAPPAMVWLVSLLRFTAVFAASFLLLNIFFRKVSTTREDPIVLLAFDNSSSMLAGPDSTAIRQLAQNLPTSLAEKLDGKGQVRTLLFGSEVRQSPTPGFSDKETDMSQLFSEIRNNYGNQNIGALVIVSDGIVNRGQNPVYDAEKTEYPVYCMASGDSTLRRDAWISAVHHNEVVYAGNNFPVELVLNARRLRGSQLKVEISGAKGKTDSRTLQVNSDNFSGTTVFTLTATEPGLQRYRVQLETINGESNTTNNSRSFVIEVISNKDKILISATAPHPDLSALREVFISASNYEVEEQWWPFNPGYVKGFSLVILHGYNAQQAALLKACTDNHIPYWIINPSSTEKLTGLRISSGGGRSSEAEPVFDRNFGLFSVSDNLFRFAVDLPAVRSPFGRYELFNGTSVLINQRIGNVETTNPILLFTENDGLRSALFAGDGLWRWKLADYRLHRNHNLFNELITRSAQFLSVKGDRSFFRITAPRIIPQNENVRISAEVYNKSYEATTTPEVDFELTNQEGKKFMYTFTRQSAMYQLDLGQLSPGDYSYRATCKFGNDLYVKQGSFSVREIFAEKTDLTANHLLLRQVSNRSGGYTFSLQQADALADSLLKNPAVKPLTYSQTSTEPLIYWKWIFFVILCAFTLEWFLRKRYFTI